MCLAVSHWQMLSERLAIHGLLEGRGPVPAYVLALGVAYKADIDDIRESPAIDIIQLLKDRQADVSYHDPHVPVLDVGGLEMKSTPLDKMALKATDCVVIATDHSLYNWPWILSRSRLVMDTRNATGSVSSDGARVVKL